MLLSQKRTVMVMLADHKGVACTNHSIGNTGDVYIQKIHPQHGLVALPARSLGYTNVKGTEGCIVLVVCY